jgi:predicted nucleic acid-binding protein
MRGASASPSASIRRSSRTCPPDLWIAATALAHEISVVTQDDDFGPVDGIGGLQVIRV